MITIDTSELLRLARGIEQYKSIMPKSVASQALRRATQVTLRSAQRLVPIGARRAPMGWGKQKGPAFARGGATRRDVRLKMVPAVGNGEIARVIIGVSKKSNAVGWRTHFITKGFTDRGGTFHRKRDFLTDARNYTIDIARQAFAKEFALSFRTWAQRNLPQGRY